MNSIQLIERSKEIFSSFEKINENFYKSKFQVEDKIAGIYYLYFNKDISHSEFEKLQYEYLANEFYSQKESLQWNIYLLFINSNISDEEKKILKDDKYARKLIFTENEYFEYFNKQKTQKTELPDIVSNWKEQLNSIGLDGVYGLESIESLTKNFFENNNSNIIRKKEQNFEDIDIVNSISSITLKNNYRSYPEQKYFEFGSVNLFVGSNGVGKTSLMESIELVLTGKTLRNFDDNEKTGCIEAIYDSGKCDKYHHNNAFYKARGIKWYERRTTELLNKTCESFNQFNFFNTDAANIFSNSQHKEHINESLKQIILGVEFTTLKDRITKFKDKLRPLYNECKKDIFLANKTIEDNLSRINELKTEKNFIGLNHDIKNNIQKLKYKNNINELEYTISSLHISDIETDLNIIKSFNNISNLKEFNEIKKYTYAYIEDLNKSKEILNENNKYVDFIYCKNNELAQLMQKIKLFLKCLEIDNIHEFDSANSELVKINSEILSLNVLKDLKNIDINIDGIFNEDKSFYEFIIDKENIISERRKILNKVLSDIEKIEKNFLILDKLKNQIKKLRNEILEIHPNLEICPFCEKKLSHSNILMDMHDEINLEVDKNILDEKNSRATELRKEISLLDIELENLKNYYSKVVCYSSELKDRSFSNIYEIIGKLLDNEIYLITRKNKIENLITQVINLVGNDFSFSNSKQYISEALPDISCFNKKSLAIKYIEIEKIINENLSKINSLKNENNNIIINVNNNFKFNEYADNFNEIYEVVNNYVLKIKSIESSFNNLNIYIDVSDYRDINDLIKEIKILKMNLESLRLLENCQNEINKLVSQNDNLKSNLTILDSKFDKLEKTINLLSELSSNSEDSILQEYFNVNLREIKDIFQSIHSPKEFTDIRYKNKDLVLFKGEREYKISEISTGQRAALVLAIFLSLNRKLKNGPNILIFDDPVTFIDDFNALSFLDFLRYFIVKEKKQIFFATANKKFAGLFKKKFDFLGEDQFKEFYLSRN